ncbi:MAG: 4-phosphoerythronate dehydrogenase [Fodinibius sp.]|nr:4-phosphoerythronate dehydrogenase [Fodinibius sp.]
MINVLADQYLHNFQSHIPKNINLDCYDPSNGLPTQLDDIHALLVRTTNDLTSQTLPSIPSSLAFVGTASAGCDHVDIDYLQQNKIAFTNAAGCNARSVAEYVATALLLWSEHNNAALRQLSVGIIGVGQVGTQVQRILDQLEVPYVSYDPPRAVRDPDFTSASLDSVLQTNILTFHTPLTRTGNHPTYHWLDADKLSGRSFELVINTSRGGVIDEEPLRKAVTNDKVGNIIIDTWENEPELSLATAEKSFIATPHIAGYSEQAKDNATKIVVEAMLDHFGISKEQENTKHEGRSITSDIDESTSLTDLLTKLHPIRDYESKLKQIIARHPNERGTRFNKLRAEYPLRQEFAHNFLPPTYFERFSVLKSLGFATLNG